MVHKDMLIETIHVCMVETKLGEMVTSDRDCIKSD